MKFLEMFRFEIAHQIRRVSIWFALAVVVFFVLLRGMRMNDGVLHNAPATIAFFTVVGGAIWLLLGAAVAGDAAARDAETRMHPLAYTAPVRKVHYLGGRFLAAFVLNALFLLAVPVGILLVEHLPGMDAALLGPFRPAAYLTAFCFIALPNAFVATAVQFSFATLSRRAVASYVGSVLLLAISQPIGPAVATLIGRWELAMLTDFVGFIGILGALETWTPVESNTRLIALRGVLLANRLLWIGIGVAALAFTCRRFRFAHHTASGWWSRIARRREAHPPAPAAPACASARSTPLSPAISPARVDRTFGLATGTRQTLAIASASFGAIARSRAGIVLLAALATITFLSMAGGNLELNGVPLFPRTDYLLTLLTASLTSFQTPWVVIPLLIVFYAGELVWREREAGLSEISDAAPVPEWALFLGKFLGLGCVLAVWMGFLTVAGILAQLVLGHHDFQIGRYLQVLFGLQLADYLLFALLALVVQGLVNHKHLGSVVALIVYGLIAFASLLGIEHRLLVYGADPGWSYTEMRGFGSSLGPWLWFKLYWTAWALLLAVLATLLWVRGKDGGLQMRLQIARRRFTRATASIAAAAVGLILALGGFIFYNTNVRNEYATASDRMKRAAAYERRYKRFEALPQPRLTGANLHVEIYPDRRSARIRGTYRLVNRGAAAIDTIHVATVPDVEATLTLDRPAGVRADEELGHRIYTLATPLLPAQSLRLSFAVRVEPHGFGNDGIDSPVVANGTYLTNEDWLPAIGYQADRELDDAGHRRAHGLDPRPRFRSLYDAEARKRSVAEERLAFEAVVGTDDDQIAVAPGVLRGTWTTRGRRYFHYSTDGPIFDDYSFFSAKYAVREARWNDVAIRIFHHPRHTANVDRMLRGVQASLGYYTEQFGPYPYRHMTLVERPGLDLGMHADATLLDYEEAFDLLNPEGNPRGPDLPFSVIAHEVAHQWWGSYLAHARVEGAVLLSETLAQYSALQVMRKTHGEEHVRRILLGELRTDDETPRTRAAPPLLQATDRHARYRKGPRAMYALSRYVGEERVNGALRRFLEQHHSGARPLATTLDLYRELQSATPPALRPLLHDLFAANTFWELATERVSATQTAAGTWQVTLRVHARKVVVDTAGVETVLPMDDPVEIGVFAPVEEGEAFGEPLYLQMHRIRSGTQTITVTVPSKPASAGIDPNYLLTDWEWDDNEASVVWPSSPPPGPSSQSPR